MTAGPSNWGAFGPSDELGTLNYLTPEAVQRGIAAAVSGERHTLNLPLEEPAAESGVPAFKPHGAAFQRVVFASNHRRGDLIVNDDYVTFSTQGSSQWDSLFHIGIEEPGTDGVFYNGTTPEQVAHLRGIGAFAEAGIVGRGVLVDVARLVARGADDPLPLDHVISPEETLACLDAQQVEVADGDILCFRTGWVERFLNADPKGRIELLKPTGDGMWRVPGISPDHATLAHEQRWAAAVADNTAVEALPTKGAESAHVRMLRNLGMPFGELFDLSRLSRACRAGGRWTFLFVAVPLNIAGGAGSPANAVAIR